MPCCKRNASDIALCIECNKIASQLDHNSALILRDLSSKQRLYKGTDRNLWVYPNDFYFSCRQDIWTAIDAHHTRSYGPFCTRITKLLQLGAIQRPVEAEGTKNHFSITVKGDIAYVINRLYIHGIEIDHPVKPIKGTV